MSIIFSFIIAFSFGQEPEKLSPINVYDQGLISEAPRSVLWPTVKEKQPTFILQPQLSDAVNTFGGLQARTQGSPTFSIRGSAASGRVLTLYNDIPLNFSSGFGAPNILLPKELIGDTIIIKGPASLFYGSQAMSGSINFLPKKINRPQLTLTLSDTDESFLPWNEFSLSQNSFHVASPIYSHKKNHIQASFFTEKNDGAFPFQSQSTSGVRSHNTQNLSRGVISGKHQFDTGQLGYDLIAGKQVGQSPGALTFPQQTRQDSEGYLASIYPQYFLNDEHTLKTRLSYLQNDSEFLENGNITNFDLKTIISQSEWSAEWSPILTTQLFVDYFNHHMDSTFSGNDLSEDRFEVGPLIQIHFTPSVYLQAGGRYLDRNNKFLPTSGLYYQNKKWKTWINYSEGFRAPSLSDLFSQSPFFVGNPNLSPETSKQWEIGLSKGLNGANPTTTYELDWNFDIRAFIIDYSNFMESFQPTPGVFSKQNLTQGESKGFDFSFSWLWGPWENYYKYNYLDAKNTMTGNAFRLSPKHQLSWGVFHYIGPFKIEAQNTLWDTFFDGSSAAPVQMENWSQWNFLLHAYGFTNYSFSVGVLNAFNESKELTLNYPDPQRRYWAQLTYSF